MIRDSWLTEISSDAPCGPDLQYDPDFLALDRAARGKEEQQYGATVIPAEEPVWADVIERASAVLDRTRDLRVVGLLARGLTRTQGLAGLGSALVLAQNLLDRFWGPLHPVLIFEGEPDPAIRMNALGALAAADGLVRDVRAAVFLQTPTVTLTVQETLNVIDRVSGDMGVDPLRASIGEVIAAEPGAFGEMPAAREALKAIQALVATHLDAATSPDFEPLLAVVNPIASLVEDVRRVTLKPTEGTTADAASGATVAGSRGTGEIVTREDALRTLDRVCDFLARNEPTNPAPLLIRRAQRIMTMPFLDIIRELAPDATSQVETITGAASRN